MKEIKRWNICFLLVVFILLGILFAINVFGESDTPAGTIPNDVRTIKEDEIDKELTRPFINEGGSPPLGTSFYDLSEYMIGNRVKNPNVVVSLIFVESSGESGEKNDFEDWDKQWDLLSGHTNRKKLVADYLNFAVSAWKTAANNEGITLNFNKIEFDSKYTYTANLVSSIEPITQTVGYSQMWVNEAIVNVIQKVNHIPSNENAT